MRLQPLEVDAMMRNGVAVGVAAVAAVLAAGLLAAEPFAAQGTRPAASPQASPEAQRPATEVEGRLMRLQERTQRLEEQVTRLKTDNDRLSAGLERARANAANFLQQLKPLVEAQARLARSVAVDQTGTVRITGNLRLDNNVLEDATVVNCDPSSLSGKRACTCPDGLVAIGIELRPLATSAYPGPATYNTSLVCSRL
jgi:hypothetical protein